MRDDEFGPWQFVVLVLSIYVLIALFVDAVVDLPPDVSAILQAADFVVCLVFLGDFGYQLAKAESRRRYFVTWGWIDLLSSIPMVDAFRYGRLVRIIRVLRVMRGAKAAKFLVGYVFANRVRGAFASASVITLILMVFGAIAILNVETYPNSNITTAGDALWWAFVTITTVGYGDFFPVTAEGRIVAAVLMTAGVGLFGIFTGFVASWFVEEDTDDAERKIIAEVHALRAQLDRIEQGRPDLPESVREIEATQ